MVNKVKPVPNLAIWVAGSLFVAFMLFVALSIVNYQEKERRIDVMVDITNGNTNAGSLSSQYGQFLCVDFRDTLKAGLDDESQAVEKALFKSWRCTFSDHTARFDMTAEGQEHFTTPHGSIDLWAAH